MNFIVKFFPEITIKSKPVRRRFVSQLSDNVKAVLQELSPDFTVQKHWDKLQVSHAGDDPVLREQALDALQRIAGIGLILAVREHPLGDFDDVLARTAEVYLPRIAGKTFAVRCKRSGKHDFRSVDVERYVGGGLMKQGEAAGVNLGNPDVTVQMEIAQNRLYVVDGRYQGLGGFPLGSIDSVMSLISGGFDSPVASYLTMKRGLRTHFLFFNLGGRDHEIGVKEVALYLWQRYGSRQRVLFISVPFEEVVAELLARVQDSQMGVILKRMMLRVADRLAEELEVDALVTGEAVAQVSSQTLRNLSVIDSVTDRLVLRPLIAADKEDIIRTAGQIGTEDFAANMPEYCGVISVNPTTRARPERIAEEEARFDMGILDRAIANAKQTRIDRLAEEELERVDVEVLSVPLAESTIIDIRHPTEEELAPLQVHVPVLKIPFYELHSKAAALPAGQTYMLYCGKGVMSRLHASHLADSSQITVKVYAPG